MTGNLKQKHYESLLPKSKRYTLSELIAQAEGRAFKVVSGTLDQLSDLIKNEDNTYMRSKSWAQNSVPYLDQQQNQYQTNTHNLPANHYSPKQFNNYPPLKAENIHHQGEVSDFRYKYQTNTSVNPTYFDARGNFEQIRNIPHSDHKLPNIPKHMVAQNNQVPYEESKILEQGVTSPSQQKEISPVIQNPDAKYALQQEVEFFHRQTRDDLNSQDNLRLKNEQFLYMQRQRSQLNQVASQYQNPESPHIQDKNLQNAYSTASMQESGNTPNYQISNYGLSPEQNKFSQSNDTFKEVPAQQIPQGYVHPNITDTQQARSNVDYKSHINHQREFREPKFNYSYQENVKQRARPQFNEINQTREYCIQGHQSFMQHPMSHPEVQFSSIEDRAKIGDLASRNILKSGIIVNEYGLNLSQTVQEQYESMQKIRNLNFLTFFYEICKKMRIKLKQIQKESNAYVLHVYDEQEQLFLFKVYLKKAWIISSIYYEHRSLVSEFLYLFFKWYQGKNIHLIELDQDFLKEYRPFISKVYKTLSKKL